MNDLYFYYDIINKGGSMNNIQDNTIVITINKNKLRKEISNKIVNIKIMTIKEFINSYYFTYDNKTIYYLMNKYNIKADIARIYLDNLYYINNTCNNTKIDKLFSIKSLVIFTSLKSDNEDKIISNFKVIIIVFCTDFSLFSIL